jgi:Lactoylglutathione lyase and related lyases
MKKIDTVTHIGITVSDLDVSSRFYCEALGFEPLRRAHFPEAFFIKNKTLYNLGDEMICDTAVLVSPDGLQLELFRFKDMLPAQTTPWNRVGITHFAVTTDDVETIAQQLRDYDAQFMMEIGVRPDGGHWLFVRDPDGNLIEIMEPFRM